jgi:hypothetical protein
MTNRSGLSPDVQHSSTIPSRTSNFHFAAMRCAEQTARGLSVQTSPAASSGR